MMRFWAICRNTFVQTIRQPAYGVLAGVGIIVLILLPFLASYTMGDSSADYQKTDQGMLMQMGLSTILAASWLIAALSASATVNREIEDRTALTVISKPVPRATFVLGKFGGVAGAVAVAFYLMSLVFLMTARHKVMSSASDEYDMPVLVLGIGAAVLGMAVAISGNILFGWPFISGAVWSLLVTLSVAMGLISFIGKGWRIVPPGYDVPPRNAYMINAELRRDADLDKFKKFVDEQKFTFDKVSDPNRNVVVVFAPQTLTPTEALETVKKWEAVKAAWPGIEAPAISGQLLIAIVMTFLGVLVFVAVAIAASTRFGQVATLIVCLGVFLAGTLYSGIFGPYGELNERLVLGEVASVAMPKLTLFYAHDALITDKAITMDYVGMSALYCLLYVGGILAVGVAMFQRRSLHADSASAGMPAAVSILAWIGRAVAVLSALIGVEAFLSFLVSRWDSTFHPLVYNSFAAAFGPGLGLAAAAGVLAQAVAAWLVWTYFGRGKRWAHTLVLVTTAFAIAWAAAAIALGDRFPGMRRGRGPYSLVIDLAVAAVVMLVLLLPSTRRHFRETAH
ncbi:MAG: ABC transporter permease subunit [Phycisphaerae bacterium]